MQKETWIKVKEIIQEVLNLKAAERRDFLDNAHLSSDVRQEVESLLAFEGESENLMELSAIEFSTAFFAGEDAANNLIGQNVGAFKIIGELGAGGMGAVYLAERADGKFAQKVALKLLKREMNTEALRRRFEQEREILAALDHPNIARLLDAGTTIDKIPFLAMEYVDGLPIDDYCREHKLNLTSILELFRKVCATVNFAHQNLVVHRDLKPSNILVTKDGTPKLLDFGISKILSAKLENTATITKLGAMTPGYASPEQLRNESVTTATDIYSLGVILYELLSGHRPFESQESDLKAIYQAVLETEPPPPSAAISAGGWLISDSSGGIVSSHKNTNNQNSETNPQSAIQNPKLKGDLDNIVLKALRKEPERRYSSAENLSEDVRRHLTGLPVTARPNTLAYRAEKFIKRNTFAVAAGLLMTLAILGGMAATLWQARIAQTERTRAEKRFNDVRKLANSYLFDIFPEIEDLAGSLKAREKILQTALEYLDSLSQEAAGDTELQLELATAYEKIGEVQGAVNISNLGDINAGLVSFRKAQKLREAAVSTKPEVREALSRNYQVIAQTLQWNVDTASAEEYFEKAVKIRRELVAQNPDSLTFRTRLAVLLSDSATIPIHNVENEKASRLLIESAEILKAVLKADSTQFYTQKAYPRILRANSVLKSNTGDFDGAIRDLDESVVLTDALIKQKPEDYALRRTASLNDSCYCEVYVAKRDGKKILETCAKVVDFNIKALEKEPDESFALYDLGTSNYNIAKGYGFLNEPQRAIEYNRKALEPLSKLIKIASGSSEYLRSAAVVENEIGNSLLTLNQIDDALEYLQKAQTKMEKVVETDKTVTSYQAELIKVYRSLAKGFNRKGDQAKSLEFTDKAIVIAARLKSQNKLVFTEKNTLEELEEEKAQRLSAKLIL